MQTIELVFINMVTRLLVTIPHYFGKPLLKSTHGSSSQAADRRLSILTRTITAIHQTLGSSQVMMQISQGRTEQANSLTNCEITVILCTSARDHLVEQLQLSQGRYEHVVADIVPTHLGYACHDQMLQLASDFDWFMYLEDDLLVLDPMYLEKSRWFLELAGEDCVLQPNRFEANHRTLANKAYVDGSINSRATERFQNISEAPELRAPYQH